MNDPLIIIVGPTGVGKSQLAFEIACKMDGEILSADSRLFYRGMDIGTAKPSKAMQEIIPHHLIDIVEPDENVSIRVFQQKVDEILKTIYSRKHIPILVGGTGQYINAIIEGWSIPPQKPNNEIRRVLAEWVDEVGAKAMYEKLKYLDPKAASKIDYRNIRRTIRALEVILGTGKLFSKQRLKKGCNYSIKIIGLNLPRNILYEQIDQRIEKMFEDGLVDEVNKLMKKGYSKDLPSMSAIGYREIIEYLENRINLEDARVLIKRRTRQFVRRQANWFKKNDKRIHWFTPSSQLTEEVMNFIQSSNGWILKKT